ncbi:MAG: zinc-binding dehydrogenase [Bacillus sp. (in: firmicutes)]
MKAWAIDQAGSLNELKWKEVEDAKGGADELVVKVASAALNPIDYKVIKGGNANWTFPHVPGVDLAGEVVEVGQGVEGFRIGDRIACHTDLNRNGAFAEYAAVKALAAAKIPASVSYDKAAAVLCAGLTAYQAIVQKLNDVDKDTILIHAGAGGVGGFSIQLAKELGLRVFTTASSVNHQWVKELGADVAIDYKKEDVTARIMEMTNNEGVDLIFNTVSAEEATKDLDRLAFSGQLAYIAGKPDMSNIKPFTLAPSLHEVALGAAYTSGSERALRNLANMTTALLQLVKKGTLNPMISEVLTCSELPEGLEKLTGRHVSGKLVVHMQKE